MVKGFVVPTRTNYSGIDTGAFRGPAPEPIGPAPTGSSTKKSSSSKSSTPNTYKGYDRSLFSPEDWDRLIKSGSTGSAPKKPASTTAPLAGAGVPAAPAAGGSAPTAPAAGGDGEAAPASNDFMGMLANMGASQEQAVPMQPTFAPGLRPGLGQRAYPARNPALAALRGIY